MPLLTRTGIVLGFSLLGAGATAGLPASISDAGSKSVEACTLVNEPLKVWLLYDYCSEPAATDVCGATPWADARNKVAQHLGEADRIFSRSHAGISFANASVNVISGNRELEELIYRDAIRCHSDPQNPDLVANLTRELAAFTGQTETEYSQHLNVFYVRHPLGFGQWCGQEDPYGPGRDTILMGRDARLRTLAHEIGHAYLNSGAHVDDTWPVSFSEDDVAHNLMRVSSPGDRLTSDQVSSAHMNPGSIVNRHSAGSRQTTCSAAAISDAERQVVRAATKASGRLPP